MTKTSENRLDAIKSSEEQETSTIEKKYVPAIDSKYYTYGNYNKVLKIIESGKYYPIWITGLAGNGKTQMIEQACARAGLPEKFYDSKTKPQDKSDMLRDHEGKGREFIRVNFTMETDENDLIGGFRLTKDEDGSVVTTFHEGPVVDALRRGAVLLLDEIDVGHVNKVMCLQSVLENKGVLIKATGEYVKPAKGFQVFATSNTKGRGSEDGTFMGTNIMNGAFLDRFAGMIYQDYPLKKIEDTILKRYYINYNWADKTAESDIDQKEYEDAAVFIHKLCEWAEHIRKNHEAGSCDDVITTRSLINIIQGYSIFNDAEKAIEMACERFDADVRESFVDIYKKLNASSTKKVDNTEKKTKVNVEEDEDYIKIS